ncbi:hypothetical protein GF336_06100 [Candidatus Woesearchaeota archaeon]|nr:hypothetical protein [Candidatus Woesearchaeota archaeon]
MAITVKEVINPEITDILKKAIEKGEKPFKHADKILEYCPDHGNKLITKEPIHEINNRYVAHKICPGCSSIYVTTPTEEEIAKYKEDLRLVSHRL